MPNATGQGELFERRGADDATIHVNVRCAVRVQDGHWLVLVFGIPLLHFAAVDAMAKAYASVSIVEQGWATQIEVAHAFGCTPRTIRRSMYRFEKGGLRALGRTSGYPAGRPRRSDSRAKLVHRLKSAGASNRSIAARLGVTENAVRKALRRLGWMAQAPEQTPLAFEAAPAGPAAGWGLRLFDLKAAVDRLPLPALVAQVGGEKPAEDTSLPASLSPVLSLRSVAAPPPEEAEPATSRNPRFSRSNAQQRATEVVGVGGFEPAGALPRPRAWGPSRKNPGSSLRGAAPPSAPGARRLARRYPCMSRVRDDPRGREIAGEPTVLLVGVAGFEPAGALPRPRAWGPSRKNAAPH